jgi:hypothetical protein
MLDQLEQRTAFNVDWGLSYHNQLLPIDANADGVFSDLDISLVDNDDYRCFSMTLTVSCQNLRVELIEPAIRSAASLAMRTHCGMPTP